MSKEIFLSIVGLGIILLIIHSVKCRGGRRTILFFAWGILYGIFKGNSMAFWKIVKFIFIGTSAVQKQPYFFTDPNILRIGDAPLVECLGWTFTFYLSWTFAEKVLSKTKKYKENVFAILFLSCLISSAICYSIEPAGIIGGLWKWRRPLWLQTSPYIIGVPPHALKAWFFAACDMLFVFLIIEYSRIREKKWKYVFFPFFALHQGFVGVYFITTPRKVQELVVFIILLLLAFAGRLKYSKKCLIINNDYKNKIVGYFPELALILMLTVVFYIELIHRPSPYLIITSLPVIGVLLMGLHKKLIPAVFAASIMGIILGGKLMVPFAVIPFFSMIWLCVDYFHKADNG